MKKIERNLCMPAMLLALYVQDNTRLPELLLPQAEALPVTWIYVKTNQTACNTIVVRWATMAEPENRLFVIERSEDGNVFTQIETLPGYGSNGNNYYQVSDEVIGERKYYYRIGLRNSDGNVEYSPTVVARMKKEQCISVQLSPNPAQEIIYFEAVNGKEQAVDLRITDMSGKIYCYRNVQLSPGRKLPITVAPWPPGAYLLNIIGRDGNIIAGRYFLKQ